MRVSRMSVRLRESSLDLWTNGDWSLSSWGTPGLPEPRLLQSLGSVLSGSSGRQLLLLTLGDAPETGHRAPGPLLEGRGSLSVS